MSAVKYIAWATLSLFAAFSLGTVALSHGETISAFSILAVAVSILCIGDRFYSLYIGEHALRLDATLATPAWRRNDGLDTCHRQARAVRAPLRGHRRRGAVGRVVPHGFNSK